MKYRSTLVTSPYLISTSPDLRFNNVASDWDLLYLPRRLCRTGLGDDGNPNDQRTLAYRYLNAVRALGFVLHVAFFCNSQAPSVAIVITANS